MYSTEIGELAHKTQIKEGWRQSNKNHAARQILHRYGGQHAIWMRLLNLESLEDCGQGLSAGVLKYFDRTTSKVLHPVIRQRILMRHRDDVSNVDDFSRILGVSLDIIYRELIPFSRHNLLIDHRLLEDYAILRSLLEFVTGRGGACFHSAGPALTTGRGGYFGGDPRPAPSGASPRSFPGRSPVSPHLF